MLFIQEEAVVSEVKNGFAYLSTNNASCESCSSQSSCSSFPFFPNSPKKALKVLNKISLEKGDRVLVELKTEKLMIGTFLVYILPLFILLLFSGLGKLFLGEVSSIFFGIAGLFISLFLIRYFMSKKGASEQFEPTILQKIVIINPAS